MKLFVPIEDFDEFLREHPSATLSLVPFGHGMRTATSFSSPKAHSIFEIRAEPSRPLGEVNLTSEWTAAA